MQNSSRTPHLLVTNPSTILHPQTQPKHNWYSKSNVYMHSSLAPLRSPPILFACQQQPSCLERSLRTAKLNANQIRAQRPKIWNEHHLEKTSTSAISTIGESTISATTSPTTTLSLPKILLNSINSSCRGDQQIKPS